MAAAEISSVVRMPSASCRRAVQISPMNASMPTSELGEAAFQPAQPGGEDEAGHNV